MTYLRHLTTSYSDYDKYISLLKQLKGQYSVDLSYAMFNKIPINTEYQNIYLMCEIDAQQSEKEIIIGTVKILWEQKHYYNNCWVGHIEDVIIDDNYRGKGYGSNLISLAVYQCKLRPCYKIIANCNNTLKQFYYKLGFSEQHCHMIYRLGN